MLGVGAIPIWRIADQTATLCVNCCHRPGVVTKRQSINAPIFWHFHKEQNNTPFGLQFKQEARERQEATQLISRGTQKQDMVPQTFGEHKADGVPAVNREYGSSVCKTEGCKYEYKSVPRKLWVAGDGIWECPECGYGVAVFEDKDFSSVDDKHAREVDARIGASVGVRQLGKHLYKWYFFFVNSQK